MMDDDKIAGEGRLTRRSKAVTFLIHLIFIGMLFVLPEILNSMGRPFQTVPQLKYGVYAKALVFIAVFYVNYCFIIGHSFEHGKRTWRLIACNLVVIALAFGAFELINEWMQPYWDEAWRIRQQAHGKDPAIRPHHQTGLLHTLKWSIRDFVMLVLTIALAIALKLSDTWISISRRSQQLLAAHRQEELESLKSQLNPHFLFNTLNTIYALIAVSPSQAQDAVHELSGMLRYVLYDNRREVELDRELRFIRSYVELMSLRLPATTKVSCRLDAGGEGRRMVPPMLMIPLIENAFKHSNSGNGDARIEISVEAGDDRIVCRTTNTIVTGGSENPDRTVSGDGNTGGIGLQNLRRRLQLIYGDSARLKAGEGAPGMYEALLEIPINLPMPGMGGGDAVEIY